MSVNTPPTENIPIFDPSVFPSSSGTALTIATGLDYFLSYPVAQGSEIFPSNVTLQSTLTDASGDVGTSGQVLTSTGTGTNWTNGGTNGYITYNASALPFTLPVSTYVNLFVFFTGSTSGILTLPLSGFVSGSNVFIKNTSLGTVNIATTYISFIEGLTSSIAIPLGYTESITLFFNGSVWVQSTFTNSVNQLTVTSAFYPASVNTDSIVQKLSHTTSEEIDIYSTTTIGDIYLGKLLPSPYTLRLCNTTTGASGASVHVSNIGFDGNNINHATSPASGIIKLGNSATTGQLFIGGGSTTAVHTTGPIIIGSDSTASGGINIATGTNMTVPTVNTVNIGSGTYATNIKGTLTSTGNISALTTSTISTASGNISSTSGNITTAGVGAISTTGTGSISTASGSITSTGIITGTSFIGPSLNASANTTNVGISTTQTSGTLSIGTGSRTTAGTISIGTGSGATANVITIGGGSSVTSVGNSLSVGGTLTATGSITANGGVVIPSGDTISGDGSISITGTISTSNNISTSSTGTITTLTSMASPAYNGPSGNTTAMTLGAAQTTGAISIGGAQTTGDINIGANSTSDIYIGNVASGATLNAGACHINKCQFGGNGTYFREIRFGQVAGSVQSATVSFGTAMISTPYVYCQLIDNSTTAVTSIVVSAVSSSSFVYTKGQLTSAASFGGAPTLGFYWIAVSL